MTDDDSRMVSGARKLTGHEVLVVDAADENHRMLLALLAPEGLAVTALVDAARALDLVAEKFFAVIVVDVDTPSLGTGPALVTQLRQRSPQSAILLCTPRKSFEAAIEGFRAGADDVLWRSPTESAALVQRILDAAGGARRAAGGGGGGDDALRGELRLFLDDTLKALMAADRRAYDLDEAARALDPERPAGEEMRVLCVDADERVFRALKGLGVPGFSFAYAQSGGEALDRISNLRFQLALCGPNTHDMPGELVIRAIKSQAPDVIVMAYAPGGKLEIVESSRRILLVERFTKAQQLTERLAELAEAHGAKERERRFLQAFRERHYEFLRRFAELRKRLEEVG